MSSVQGLATQRNVAAYTCSKHALNGLAKSIAIDLYRKNNAGEWIFTQYRSGDTVELKSINLSFPIEQVYRGIMFE